jgi:hypothetical protein
VSPITAEGYGAQLFSSNIGQKAKKEAFNPVLKG